MFSAYRGFLNLFPIVNIAGHHQRPEHRPDTSTRKGVHPADVPRPRVPPRSLDPAQGGLQQSITNLFSIQISLHDPV